VFPVQHGYSGYEKQSFFWVWVWVWTAALVVVSVLVGSVVVAEACLAAAQSPVLLNFNININ